MTLRSACVAISLVALASRAGAQATPPTSGQPKSRDVLIEAAPAARLSLAEFLPDLPPVEGAFECGRREAMGSNLTTISVAFPTPAESRASVVVLFDSTGKMLHYAERRGAPIRPAQGARATLAEIEAAARVARSTTITLDFAHGRATIANRGGGLPDQVTVGSIDAVESMEKFGKPLDRAARIVAECRGK
jgi:hypothetical protein